ncbi:uncharacterized protein TNIN_499671 [Trichonephila inaurata madagascariensis]|uniref:Uncharacterized protein n=1 Tax=Trichonephila inaurata madagascariensis TaxID=2747483 RepID=A0A8X6XAB8_9ARAC|nr:uncharacterized protein TNIN_499671 [Trichonephila inaurata madagascariensis]
MENSRTPEVYLEDLSAGDNSKASCFNDIIEPKGEIKNKPYQQELSESTHHFNDEKEENDEDEKVKKGTLFQNIPTEAEFIKTVEQKTRSGELEISEQENCTVGNQTDLITYPANSKHSSSVTDHADTSKSELIKDDALLCEKIDDKCCNNSKSLDKARKFGVNPIQIGILINKKDFLDHCNMVKNGLKKSYRKKRPSSLSKQGTVLEEQSNSISLRTTHLSKNTISKTEADSTSQSSSSDKQVVQATSCKSVSDLVEYFEYNSDSKKAKEKPKITKNFLGNYLKYPEICTFKNLENYTQGLLKSEKYDETAFGNSKQKLCVRKNCDVKKSKPCKNVQNASDDQYIPFLRFLEELWFLSFVITIFYHFVTF